MRSKPKHCGSEDVMSSYCTIHSVLLLLTFSSLVPVSGTWCNRYSSFSDCGFNQVCCKNFCVSGSDCFNRFCTSDNDCSITEICCSHKCKNSLDCTGYNCATNYDCGSMGLSCCDGTCQSDICDFVAVIVGSICGVVVFVIVVSFIIYCFCRRRQRHPGRVITATTVPQAHPTYPVVQVPPSYQQAYPGYPHPQFERPQTAAPPPYNPEGTSSGQQPPPYNEVVQGSSGRINTPQTYYGAVPTPSAPPPQ